MQISSRFTIAVHVLIAIEVFKDSHKATSEFLSSSVCVNPVIIRRLLAQLKGAGLLKVARGSGGAELAIPPEKITLLDIYQAVDPIEKDTLFHFHDNPNQLCPVGRNIHAVLDAHLEQTQKAMEGELSAVPLSSLIQDATKLIKEGM